MAVDTTTPISEVEFLGQDIPVATKGGGESASGQYLVQVIDYDGTVIKSTYLNKNDSFTIPDAPPEHEGLVFDGWSSPVEIIDNVVTVDHSDITIGPMYSTTSEKTEVDIEMTEIIGKTFEVYLYTGETIEWGDDSTETATADGYITHEYADYGSYTIMISGDNTVINTKMFNNVDYRALNNAIKHIRIKSGVTSINEEAFRDCIGLQSVTLPNSVTVIGARAFRDCLLLKTFIIPTGVTIIAPCQSCSNIQTVVIPYGATSINGYAFTDCASLQSITIPDSVTNIENYAFSNGYGLNKVFLSKSVTTINRCFTSCHALKTLNIPEGVTSIANSAFSGLNKLTSITLPDGLISIGDSAFSGCFDIQSINIPSSVVSIGMQAFYTCYRLISFDHYFKVTSASKMFQDCESIVTIKGPDLINLTSIANFVYYCVNLTNLEIYNIRANLSVGSGTLYGHLLTLESLCHTIKELWDLTGSTQKTLTVGSANLEKLTNIYVKTITITDDMRTDDENIDSKLPFEVCESTDEGAMLITDYVLLKNWKLA